jgi:hypothetical protein
LRFFLTNEHRMSAAEQLRHAPHTAVPGVTPAPPPYTQAMRMNSLNTLNGAGPQVGTMVNVCQIPKRSYTPSPPSAPAGHSAAELRATWSRSGANCQYCKAIATARARALLLSRNANPFPYGRSNSSCTYSRSKLLPRLFCLFRACLARRLRCDMQGEITD